MLGAGADETRCQRQFLIADDSDQGAVLHDRHPEIGKTRQGIRKQCRQHDAAEAQARSHAEGLGRLDLADGDCQDRAAQHFGHIGALHETEHGDGNRKAVQLEGRKVEEREQPVKPVHAGIVEADDEDQFRHGADGGRVELEKQTKRPVPGKLAERPAGPENETDQECAG